MYNQSALAGWGAISLKVNFMQKRGEDLDALNAVYFFSPQTLSLSQQEFQFSSFTRKHNIVRNKDALAGIIVKDYLPSIAIECMEGGQFVCFSKGKKTHKIAKSMFTLSLWSPLNLSVCC